MHVQMYILVFMGLGVLEPLWERMMAGAGLAGEKGLTGGCAAEVEGAV